MSDQRRPQAAPRRPLGQPTRGKTARNRLRRVDTFLALYDPGLFCREGGAYAGSLVVDLGYGFEPVTTLETAARLRRINPELRVLGVEIDPDRVAAAQPYADELTCFRLGGFNLPLRLRGDGTAERARVIRAFNVLRQYPESEVAAAWEMMGRSLLPGGLLIEGTAEPFGRVWVANLLRRGPHSGLTAGEADAGLRHEGLVFSTNFRLGFDPAAFQAVLPKNLIHRVIPGEPIHTFFAAWKRAAQETSATQVWGMRQWFVAAAQRLAALGYAVALRRKLLDSGYLLVRDL